ncbi:CRISPR-associated protein, Csa5 family [Metallosphaera sedula]|uniref:CRISPR-associated protein, Csa5 family n=3 Tax=Metallosphaera TaxID=41980 RepID=A4YFV3_METS5|nr:type I-A CRISPR-associated protein Csa5 [Metallosphaera sedula]ABP95305.1 CRISPR-associated protein, Csa5 family [Metallosphaera sedula DSM 5348]AIM27291.1 CRISPR-associated protein, Csa5 family [Metallosphaera sedula]AKV74178.1 CRISPR-associated protein Csa5 [Metallosphaera sedula]AKV76417.1 CRISPR-associated protein Csa5 [Metallosphaera sedula]AKV78669.1 CRISPR-associated protein Csa5 [Metallosphaera sedula]
MEPRLRRVANLLATASIYAETPTLLDRISNALSKEAAVKVIGDCERIVNTGLNRGEIRLQTGENPRIYIDVKEGERTKTYELYGSLSSSEDVTQFIEDVERDIYTARKVGAVAMATVNGVL